MSFHGGLRRLSMAPFTVHIRPYSFIFDHIHPYSFIFMASFTIRFVHIRPYSSIYDTIYDHLRPCTSIYIHLRPLTLIDVDHLRPWAWEAWLFPKYKNCFFRKYKNPIISNPYEMNLLQRKIENRGYLEKSRFDRWKPGKSTFSPKTWNHPMVIAVILGGAVCSKHTLKVEFCQNPCSVNVRVFVDVRASDPQNLKVPHPKWCHWWYLATGTTQIHFFIKK